MFTQRVVNLNFVEIILLSSEEIPTTSLGIMIWVILILELLFANIVLIHTYCVSFFQLNTYRNLLVASVLFILVKCSTTYVKN